MKTAKEIYRIVSSMKTGLILLVIIGIVSAVGSVFFSSEFFSTVVFRALLLLLLLNMVMCTINRLFLFKTAISKLKTSKSLIRQVGILFLHAGIVVILIGGAVFSFFGRSEEVSLAPGKTVDVSKVLHLDQPIFLKLNSFKIELNKDGSPSQYYSDMTVFEKGKNQGNYVISVNHPLQYEKIKAYQESFGYLVKTRTITGSEDDSEQLLQEGNFVQIPDSERTVKIYRYFSDFDSAKGMNQTSLKKGDSRIVYSVYEGDELLGVGAAKFGSKIKIDEGKFVVFDGVEPYTILKVKSDPGLKLVLIGSIMFMLGIIMALIPNKNNPGQRQFMEQH